MNEPARRLSVVGLGKLGAPMAACLAHKGFEVIGVDLDPAKVDTVNRGWAPVFEPGLDDLMSTTTSRLTATTNIEEAVKATEATFIVVPTPSTERGDFSLRFVLSACEPIARALQAKDQYHLVILTSTVMPGVTGGEVLKTLESLSGKRAGPDFGLCYSPEFIALGSVISDFLHPDFLLIGSSDENAAAQLEKIYQRVCEDGPPIARMNFVNAELAKLAVNTFVTTKISFANMLARICESLPGADVDTVTSALGLDSRIGPRYLKGAIPYGGPCFPRDNLALRTMADDLGAPADIAKTTDRFNRDQVRWLADTVRSHLEPGRRVGILGITYKAGSDVVEEATGLLLAQELIKRDIEVVCFDPTGLEAARGVLGDSVSFAEDPEGCVVASDVVVVATAWAEILDMPRDVWANSDRPRTIIDCWRALASIADDDGVNYVPLGVSGR